MKVSFRYCGSCNPQLDLTRIEEEIRKREAGAGVEWTYVPLGEETELCILLNGCPVGCANEQYAGSAPVRRLTVRGWKADGTADWIWEEGE